MYRLLIRSGLTATVAVCAPIFAQESQPVDPQSLDIQAFDPRAPMPAVPEIEQEWQSLVDDTPEIPQDTAVAEAATELRYSFDLAPIQKYPLADEFRKLSVLHDGRGKPVPSLAELRRRVRVDSDLLRRLFRAEGYYDPEILIEVDPTAVDGVVQVLTSIDPGPLYKLEHIDLRIKGDGEREIVSTTLGISVGDPVDAVRLNTALDKLRLGLAEQGFPFAKVEDPEIVLDHETRTAMYTIDVNLGDKSRFGQIRVEGDALFSAKHIGRLARFKPGDEYDSSQLEDLRRAIIATGLVSTVSIKPVRQPPREGEPATVDLAIQLTPAPMRTIAGQIGFSTTEGFRVEGSWQHRNFIRPQGQVTFRGVVGTEEQRVSADLRRSNWKRRDRTLGARVEASVEDRAAFFARSIDLNAFIERETNIIWQKTWTYRIGAELLATEEKDRSVRIAPGFEPRQTFFIAAAPTQLAYDGSDDLLDPTTGFRLTAYGSPEISLQNGAFGYLRAQVQGSAYLPLVDDKLVIAGRAHVGTIFGAERSRIAPSRRFYAGGGGSVRGYGYQDVGPRDLDGDPLGGRSLTEFSVEARYRFGTFGIVPFIDGGQVDTNVYPRFKNLQFGAGIGARYYTSFGPVRLDVATPINPQPGDPRVAVYVSIGQAF